ncbi:MAG: iron ABC transporter permease [Bacteroidales bacterium]|nr:iron ABC transporter permease [Bacteroidales bacterium]
MFHRRLAKGTGKPQVRTENRIRNAINRKILFIILILLVLGAAALTILSGSVAIPAFDVLSILAGDEATNPAWTYIIWQMRIPATLTAMLTGAALSVAGLLLQSYFRNPLAGPSILGITSGSHLAVAITILLLGTPPGFGLVIAAFFGALLILLILLGLGGIVRQPVTLLIVGILLSYLSNAILTLLSYSASADGIQALMLWGMGSFNQVGMAQMPLFASLILASLTASCWLIKPLNGWMLGDLYARNLGVSIPGVRWGVLMVTGLLCAVTTAWCGPIAFIGLSIPHVARMMFRTDNHRILLPASLLLGSLCALICLWLSSMPSNGRTLPINALTQLFGIPVILYVLLRRKS